VLNDAADARQPRLTPEQRRTGIGRVLAVMRAERPDFAGTIAALRPNGAHAAFCPAWLERLRAAIATTPADDSVSPLRAILSPADHQRGTREWAGLFRGVGWETPGWPGSGPIGALLGIGMT
jgi:hypothetical protein